MYVEGYDAVAWVVLAALVAFCRGILAVEAVSLAVSLHLEKGLELLI